MGQPLKVGRAEAEAQRSEEMTLTPLSLVVPTAERMEITFDDTKQERSMAGVLDDSLGALVLYCVGWAAVLVVGAAGLHWVLPMFHH